MPNTIENSSNAPTAKLATLKTLLATVIPSYLSPPPAPMVLRRWFNDAKIPRFQSNPNAKYGGGPAFYSVEAVEAFFREHTTEGPR